MVGYLDDISRFGYGNGYSSIGVVPTPLTMGAPAGASNPIGSYYQQAAASAPVSGISGTGGVDPWANGGINLRSSVALPPSVNNVGSMGSGLFGTNLNGFDFGRLALGGLQTIGNLWNAWEANKLAKEQFKFQKGFANANLANQIQSYNTTLEDRSRARTFTEGGTDADAQAYIDANKLRKPDL